MAGYTKDEAAEATFVRNLQWAADLAPEQSFTIEPLNSGDQPGYFLDDYALAARILDAVDRPNVRLQYDSYHAAVIHGDALQIWETYKDRVTHVQIGAAPARSEPGTGPTNFPALFAAIDASSYAGWVSAEYHPSTARTEDSLHLAEMTRRQTGQHHIARPARNLERSVLFRNVKFVWQNRAFVIGIELALGR